LPHTRFHRTLLITVALCALLAYLSNERVRVSTTGRAKPQRPLYAFSDVTRQVGIPQTPMSNWGSVWVDHDRDGDADLLLNRHLRFALLFEKTPLGYERRDVRGLRSPAPGRRYYDRHACAWGEANGDGRPDLYCTSGAQKGDGVGLNQLLVQTADGLEEVAAAMGVQDRHGRGRTVNWIDFEQDGDLDLFVGNEVRGRAPNVTYRNDGGRFTKADVGLSRVIATVNSTVADWDNDGDSDLLVLGDGQAGSVAYENEGGRFSEETLQPVTGRKWTSAAWGDYDGDGWVDLHLVSRWRSLLLRNARGRLVKVSVLPLVAGRMSTWLDVENDGDLDLFVLAGSPRPRWADAGNQEDFLLVQDEDRFHAVKDLSLRGPLEGSGDAVSATDYDRDGRVDLFVTNGYLEAKGIPQLLRNDSVAGNATGLTLIGDAWNPFGFGARVTVRTDRLRYRRYVTDAFNFKSQSGAGYLHLGLGASRYAEVEISWPDGTRDCVTVVAGPARTITKGSTDCRLSDGP